MANHEREGQVCARAKAAKGTEIDSPGAEVFVEKPLEMARVMVDGRTIQPSFFLQKWDIDGQLWLG